MKYYRLQFKDAVEAQDKAGFEILCEVLRAVVAGATVQQMEDMQTTYAEHMGLRYYSNITWMWNEAIDAIQKEEHAREKDHQDR